jgi:hypothetical protein
MARAIKTRFSFRSEGETLMGNLFLPGPSPSAWSFQSAR